MQVRECDDCGEDPCVDYVRGRSRQRGAGGGEEGVIGGRGILGYGGEEGILVSDFGGEFSEQDTLADTT
jgi:hypothetical protein